MGERYIPSRGPFRYVASSSPKRAAILDAYGNSVASLIGLSAPHEMDANGFLLAAAPDLLAACKLALSSCDPHAGVTRLIQAAIDKAEGGSNEER